MFIRLSSFDVHMPVRRGTPSPPGAALIWPLAKLFVVLWIALLVACGPSASSQVLLEYRRTGGFAGLDDRLVIAPAGDLTITRKSQTKTGKLDSNQVAQIERQLDAAMFQSLAPQYPAATGADLLSYTITYNGKTVSAMDTAVPDQLLPVIQTLNQLIERGP